MNPKIAAFVSALRVYNPESGASPIDSLYAIVGPIEDDPMAPQAFPEIFGFFERYPEADLGMPGPLVHLIERHTGKYETLLTESVRRAPSISTVSMINRILNAKRSTKETEELMSLLVETAANPKTSDFIRGHARHYYEHQSGG